MIDRHDAGFPLQFLYELGGLRCVDRALTLLDRGRAPRFWAWVGRLDDREVMPPTPFVMEFDLVGEIAFRELDYAPAPDGGPLDGPASFAAVAGRFSAFDEEPFDLPEQIGAFTWPTVVISGDRDIRTPRTTAQTVVTTIPGAVLLPVRDQGHSTLDTHPGLALEVMRAMSRSAGGAGGLSAAVLPHGPHGRRGVMHQIVAARLGFAGIAPAAWS